mmetsp:Transcript_8534/g.23073  ORF Transcript_8534/g.23073 Transcript_8534/m.23073 type:complete len:438 (-) Transcript_8534:178-1491(-)
MAPTGTQVPAPQHIQAAPRLALLDLHDRPLHQQLLVPGAILHPAHEHVTASRCPLYLPAQSPVQLPQERVERRDVDPRPNTLKGCVFISPPLQLGPLEPGPLVPRISFRRHRKQIARLGHIAALLLEGRPRTQEPAAHGVTVPQCHAFEQGPRLPLLPLKNHNVAEAFCAEHHALGIVRFDAHAEVPPGFLQLAVLARQLAQLVDRERVRRINLQGTLKRDRSLLVVPGILVNRPQRPQEICVLRKNCEAILADPDRLPPVPVPPLQLRIRHPRVRILLPADLHRLLEQRPRLGAIPTLRLHGRIGHQQRRVRSERHPMLKLLLCAFIPPKPPLVPPPYAPHTGVVGSLHRQRLQGLDALLVLALFQIQVGQGQHEFVPGIPVVVTALPTGSGTLAGSTAPGRGWIIHPRRSRRRSLLRETGLQVRLNLFHALCVVP